jgi:hypothetical protein
MVPKLKKAFETSLAGCRSLQRLATRMKKIFHYWSVFAHRRYLHSLLDLIHLSVDALKNFSEFPLLLSFIYLLFLGICLKMRVLASTFCSGTRVPNGHTDKNLPNGRRNMLGRLISLRVV